MATDADSKNYIETNLVIRSMNERRMVVIPKEITAFEAACFAAFLIEYNERHTMPGAWRMDQRLAHYGLERFLQDNQG